MKLKISLDHQGVASQSYFKLLSFFCHPLAACTGNIVMKFYLFERRADAHIRKSREYLEEANVGRVAHMAAAEHHSALAKMYTERIARIEAEISDAFQLRSINCQPLEVAGDEGIRLKSDSVVLYPSRTSHA